MILILLNGFGFDPEVAVILQFLLYTSVPFSLGILVGMWWEKRKMVPKK